MLERLPGLRPANWDFSSNAQVVLGTTDFASCDDAFGPFVVGCRNGRLDFTLLFEQTVFAIVPSAVFILGAIVSIFQLWGQKPKVNTTSRYYFKMILSFTLIAIKTLLLLQWIRLRDNVPAGTLSVAAAAVNIADAVFLALLTNLSHMRSVLSSNLIIVFLFFSILFDLFRCRTIWLIEELAPLAYTFAAGTVAKALLFGLEARSKRSIMIEDWKQLGAEETASLVGSIFLWWVNPLLKRGNASFLEATDLPYLKPEQRSRALLPQMLQNWQRYKASRFALALMILRSCKSAVLLTAIPRVALSTFKLLVPLYIKKVINYTTLQDAGAETDKGTVYVLIGAAVLLFLGQTLVANAYEQGKARMRIMMRTSMISTILHYGTQMEPGEKKGSAALTLITVDVGRVVASFFYMHDFWMAPIDVGLAVWLLAGQVGVGSLGPLVTIIVGAGFSAFVGMYMPAAQKKLAEAVEKRISDTTTVIGSMKETKMLGLVDSWFRAIQTLMDGQIRQSVAFRRLMSVLNVASEIPRTLAAPVAFGFAILALKPGERLSVADAFTSISIMNLVITPITMMAHMFPFIISALPCFTRIQDFLKICSDYEERVALLGSSGELPMNDDLLPSLGEPIFSIANGNVTAKSKEEPLIKDATVNILPKTFNVVAGKVGTGKSVLLQALLGQLNITGNAKVRTSNVAFCAQQPWVFNGTVKENIVCKSPPDEPWYNTVVAACGLDRDFEDFSQGDATAVGTKGVSLSGGQKQRVSLARGLFSRKPILFVDDVLSGLDWATQRQVWDQVFSASGLLRKNGVTVVLATHALHLLDQPDSVILIGDDGPGSLIQGTLNELKQNTSIEQLIATSHGSTDGESTTNASSTSSQKGGTNATPSPQSDAAEREQIRKSGDITLYSYYLGMIDRKLAVTFALFCVLSSAFPILPTLWLRWWTEANESPEPVNTLYYYSIYFILNVVEIILMMRTFFSALLYLAPTTLRKVHTRLLKAMMRAPLSFFVATPPGDLVNRFSRDIEQIDLELPLNLTFVLMALSWLIALMGLILAGSLYMAVMIIPMLVFIYLLQKYYLNTSRQLRYLDLQSSAPVNTHMIEMIDGVATVQAYGWESQYQAAGMDLLDETMRPNYMMRIIQLWLELVLDLFVSGVSVLLIIVCLTIPSSTSAGALAVALTNVTNLGSVLSWLITSFTSTETSLGSVERIRSFEDNTPREAPPANPRALPSAWPSKGAVRFNSVTASYPPRGNNPAFRALNSIDVDIQAGQKVAICGRTGSGKSSMLLTLFRLLDLESGSISIDGIDITDVAHNVLRPRLITVPQEPMLLPGSLRSNLVRNTSEIEEHDDLDDEKLINHLKTVELWDVVEPQGGLDGDTADLKLSQGQKQLVCMARALASKDESSILILDEAMSTVDKQTEELMVKILEDEFAKHTIISVVHRLNTVVKFDTVLLLDAGEVVEAGSPEALLAKEDGRFRALWHGKEASS
ncbi:hypothetical protein NLG97_g7944 [Lecanicillium saksenae]|uniref:Uncharacterized protein n=1 Tax=Lecanicillium saksenae TaxID=468837 RepID=A0ACC1QNK9_9HYPO|nr:hypothetical protein NLG97_g7944 [Lecanicillium saksenae]